MINKLKDIFPKIVENSCVEYINDKEFFIYDCTDDDNDCLTGRCYINQKGQFKVLNTSKKEIGFIAVDKCIFFDDDKHKKSDCIVFDDETICFIEIKDCKVKQRSNRKHDAKLQLKATIEIFKNKIDLKKKIEAYLCIGYSPTRPSILASSMTTRAEFEEELDTSLFEGCQKEF